MLFIAFVAGDSLVRCFLNTFKNKYTSCRRRYHFSVQCSQVSVSQLLLLQRCNVASAVAAAFGLLLCGIDCLSNWSASGCWGLSAQGEKMGLFSMIKCTLYFVLENFNRINFFLIIINLNIYNKLPYFTKNQIPLLISLLRVVKIFKIKKEIY